MIYYKFYSISFHYIFSSSIGKEIMNKTLQMSERKKERERQRERKREREKERERERERGGGERERPALS